jgi:predicted TIM-barrel fold metal-dependent hydrolase
MLDVDGILRPWWDRLCADYGNLDLYDAHTHVGADDPDGVKQTPGELLSHLEKVDARAVVFPMHEPAGYPPANDRVLAAAAESDGRLVAYCRVDPSDNALEEARRCLDAGARGIKLHPRAERFTLSIPVVHELVALAHERQVPVLIHAGRGIPALGRDTVRLSGEFPDARLILAHAAISDLAWLWRVLPDHPNLLIDTAWWDPADMMALFTLCPPGNIVWASDSPYGLPLTSAVMHLRLAAQAGLDPAQLRSIAGGQMEHVLDGGAPRDVGAPPGVAKPVDPMLERVISHGCQAVARMFVRADPSEAVALAKLACGVGEESEHADVFAAVMWLLETYEEHVTPVPEGMRIHPAARLLIVAVTVARTPDVPLPELPDAPPPTREEADA